MRRQPRIRSRLGRCVSVGAAAATLIGVSVASPAIAQDDRTRTTPEAVPQSYVNADLDGATAGAQIFISGVEEPLRAPAWYVEPVDDGGMFSAPMSYALSLSARGSVANDATYTEQKWATTSYDASTLQSIQWIVALVDETGWNAWDWDSRSDALIPALERKGVPSGVTDNLDYTKAIAGIQAAIWYFTDGIAIDRERTDEAVLGLFDFLTGPENEGLTEPAGRGSQSVSLSPANLSGEAGSTVGPFTVNTDQTTALLSARDAGAWGGELLLVDEHGDELTGEPGVWGIHVPDGTNAYVELPDTYTTNDSAFIEAVVIRSWPGIVLEAEGESADLLLLDATEAVRTSSDISVTATPSPEPTSEPSTSAPTPTDPTSTPTTSPPDDTLPDTGTPSSAATALIGVLTLGIGTLLILGRKRLTNSQHH